MLLTASIVSAQVSRWESRGIGGGGALFCPRVNPHNTSELYISCDMGLAFHSTDAGRQWGLVDFKQLKADPFTDFQFTSDPSIMYVRQFDFDEYNWFPVKSDDAGKTWAELPTRATDEKVIYVYADNTSADRLIVTTQSDIHFTNDGGERWKKIHSNGESDGAYVSSVFWDGAAIYIGAGGGVIMTDDNGETFSPLSIPGLADGDGIVSFTGSKRNGTVRFFCITAPIGSITPEQNSATFEGYTGIYRCDFSAVPEWKKCSDELPDDHTFLFVAMADSNVDVAYIAGGDKTLGFPSVFKTTDGGTTWTDVFLTENNENIITGYAGRRGDYDFWWGGTALGFTVCRSNSDIAVITDFGYPHMTTDGGKLWRQMYVDEADENPAGTDTPKGKSYHGIGMEPTSSWDIHWIDSLNMFAGYSDIGTVRSTDGGKSWSRNYAGMRTNTICKFTQHPENGTVYATTSSKHELYSTIGLTDNLDEYTGGVFFSTDKGANWDTLHDFGQPVSWITLDPNNSSTMYASVVHHENGGIFVSNDIDKEKSSTWKKCADPPRTEGHPYVIRVLNDGTIVCCYSGRRDNNGFTESSGVFKSTDEGTTWEDCGDEAMRFWTMDIVIDIHDSEQNTWYAAVFGGWGGAPNQLGGLYRTGNRGTTWTRIYQSYQVSSCTNHPTNSSRLYVATNGNGLVYSDNITADNPTFSTIDNYYYQNPRRIFFNPYNTDEVWVSSGGYGIACGFEGEMRVRPVEKQRSKCHSLHVNYSPRGRVLTVDRDASDRQQCTVSIIDMTGRKVLLESFTEGSTRLEVALRNHVPGIYFVRIVTATSVESAPFVLY